jgi:hypothetical protein
VEFGTNGLVSGASKVNARPGRTIEAWVSAGPGIEARVIARSSTYKGKG